MGFLDDLKNSALGKALSEKELQEKEEQYRLLTKPIVDKLEVIEKNTSKDLSSTLPGFEIFPLDATQTHSNTRLNFSRKYFVYLGVTKQSSSANNVIVQLEESIALAGSNPPVITFGAVNSIPYTLIPGTVIPVNLGGGSKVSGFFSSVIATVDPNMVHKIINCDNPLDFLQNLPPYIDDENLLNSPHRRPAKIDVNGDQYVLFRTSPQVTLPSTQLVRVWDGVSIMDVDGSGRLTVNLAAQPIEIIQRAGIPYHQTATAAAGVGVALTITPVNGDIKINWVQIEKYATATVAGGAAPVLVTISGFEDNNANPVVMTFDFQTARLIGEVERMLISGAQIFQASPSTNVVITCPALATTIWRVNVSYQDV